MPASDFFDLCQQTIVWVAKASRDVYGKPIPAAPVTFSPSVSPKSGGRRVFKQVRKPAPAGGPAGSAVEFVQGSEIWILATPAIGLEDQVYVQGDTEFPSILNVESFPDETGAPFYVKVTLGSANG
jgi:hypothetical protein